jgi:hypothetical protein
MGLYNSNGTNGQNLGFPTTASITEAALGSTPSLIAIDRSAQKTRRGLTIENDGQNPLIFGYGTTVSVSARTIQLFPGDYFEDIYNYQGPITAMSVSGTAIANITEIVVI